MSQQIISVAVAQHPCGDSYQENLAASCAAIEEAAAAGAQLVLLQELHTNRYFCQSEHSSAFALAESIPGPTSEALGALARRLNIVLVASVFERRAAGIYHNSAVVLERTGEIAGIYRKMHIPDDPGYYEKYYFTPGDLGFTPIDTSLGRLGVLICWDQWFPEAARLMALQGAQLLLYPTAIGWESRDSAELQQRQRDAWVTVQRGHAIANGLPLLASNRIGWEAAADETDGGIAFWGGSFICSGEGELLAQAPSDQSVIEVAEIDLNQTEEIRRTWPFLRDRRIDAYNGLLQRYIDNDSTSKEKSK